MNGTKTYYLSLGSNIEPRRTWLARALAGLRRALGVPLLVSPVYESAPWGYDSCNPYLNLCAAADLDLAPEELLDITRQVERDVNPAPHRDSSGGYIDRAIDIDIVCRCDGLRYSSPRLTLPHPRAAGRDFVQVPLRQLKARIAQSVENCTQTAL